jgi:hypothetical protein
MGITCQWTLIGTTSSWPSPRGQDRSMEFDLMDKFFFMRQHSEHDEDHLGLDDPIYRGTNNLSNLFMGTHK